MRAGKRGWISLSVVALLVAGSLSGCLGTVSNGAIDPAGGSDAATPFSDTDVFPGVYDMTGPYSRPLLRGDHAILDPEVVELVGDADGAAIQIGIVRPDVPAGTRVPVIAEASPYYDFLTPERIKNNPKNDMITFWEFNPYEYLVERFVPHGYAVAFIATRGSAGSGGCVGWYSPAERDDADQAITWLAEQAWSTGEVGMIGLSYSGTTPWMVASKGNPHLKTIVPAAGYPDFFGLHNRNGTFVAQGSTRVVTFGKYGLVESNPLTGRSLDATVSTAGCPEIRDGLVAHAHTAATLARDPLGYWSARDYRKAVEENYRGSVLLATGLNDIGAVAQMYPWTRTIEERGAVVKHILGQWAHTYPDAVVFPGRCGPMELTCPNQPNDHKRWDWAEILLRWFDHWLKRTPGIDLGSGVQVQDSAGVWRAEALWPPADATARAFYLAADGALSGKPEGPAATRTVGAGRSSVVFETAPLEEPLRFAGLPTLHLKVSPMGPGGQLRAHLAVATDDGATTVGLAVMDLRVADGTETPKSVVPGSPLLARMQFYPLDVAIPEGGRLVLTITTPSLGAAGQALPGPSAPIEIAIGGEASVLTLHTFERGPEAFFEPPRIAG